MTGSDSTHVDSILSNEMDGLGYFYGFIEDDHRQINVRSYEVEYMLGLFTVLRWVAWVGDTEIGHTFTSKAAAERAAIAWARANPVR